MSVLRIQCPNYGSLNGGAVALPCMLSEISCSRRQGWAKGLPGRPNMRPKRENHYSRRTFLRAVGTSVPTLQLVGRAAAAPGGIGPGSSPESRGTFNSRKFTPIDLTPFFNCSPKDFGPREQANSLDGYSGHAGLIRTPAGRQSLRGIPFLLGGGAWDQKGWVALSTQSKAWTAHTLQKFP